MDKQRRVEDQVVVVPIVLEQIRDPHRIAFGQKVDAVVVGTMLPMKQNGHPVVGCELVEPEHVGGIALETEFLLSNGNGTQLEVFLDFGDGAGEVRDLVSGEKEPAGIGTHEAIAGFISVALGLKSIGFAEIGGRGLHGRPAGKQDGARDSHCLLVSDEVLIRSPGIPDVLVDVDDGLGSGEGSGFAAGRGGRGQEGDPGEEFTTRFPSGRGSGKGLRIHAAYC